MKGARGIYSDPNLPQRHALWGLEILLIFSEQIGNDCRVSRGAAKNIFASVGERHSKLHLVSRDDERPLTEETQTIPRMEKWQTCANCGHTSKKVTVRRTGRAMFQRHKVFLLAVSLVGWQGANASACINGHPSVADEYAASFDVVEARVAVIKRDVPHFSYVYKGEVVSSELDMFDAVTLHITRSYKHRVSGSITINNPHSTAAFPVDPGGAYLVFLRARAPSGEIIVDTCGSSRSMSRISTETLRALNELAGTGGRAGK